MLAIQNDAPQIWVCDKCGKIFPEESETFDWFPHPALNLGVCAGCYDQLLDEGRGSEL